MYVAIKVVYLLFALVVRSVLLARNGPFHPSLLHDHLCPLMLAIMFSLALLYKQPILSLKVLGCTVSVMYDAAKFSTNMSNLRPFNMPGGMRLMAEQVVKRQLPRSLSPLEMSRFTKASTTVWVLLGREQLMCADAVVARQHKKQANQKKESRTLCRTRYLESQTMHSQPHSFLGLCTTPVFIFHFALETNTKTRDGT